MGRKAIDLTGQVFGNLTVIARAENDKRNKARWLCRCVCGNEKIVNAKHLRSGDTQSCGCMQGVRDGVYRPLIERHTHNNRLYHTWSGMHQRCERPSASSYEYYGGRGIKVCAEWTGENGFDNFQKWAISNGYSDDLEIDRIDNDRGYEPNNCRWVTHQENSFNRRPRKRAPQ